MKTWREKLAELPPIASENLRARLGFGALIGRAVLDKLVFEYNGPQGKFLVRAP